MVAAIETRELITVAAGATCLRGTYHKVQDNGADSSPGLNESIRTGVLFLNSGGDPRAASGNAAVHWADSFAKCGYPSFRFDLPGLGDSDGELPEKWLDFSDLVNGGHYAAFISSTTKSLTERFNLSGVVIVGHCAGAVSAIYAATASKYVKGVVALDPYFFREEDERAAIRKGISQLVTRNKVAAQLSKVHGRLKKVGLLVKGNKLPSNANLPFIRCWNRLASAGVPILVLNTRRVTPRVGEFDYLRYLQTFSGSRVAVKLIEGANHSFADDVGKAAVRQHTERWLNACFPLVARNENAFAGQLAVNHQRWQ
jgi:pimeloyl-ACP methyl ester carboxylesterase